MAAFRLRSLFPPQWGRLLCAAACIAAPVHAAPLHFATALERVLAAHPQLAAAGLGVESARLAVDRAGQRPAVDVGVEVENLLGNGTLDGFDGAELTLDFTVLVERRGKRAGRLAAAGAGVDIADADRRVVILDLGAETARRFLAVAAAAERQRQAGVRLDLARAVREAVEARVAAVRSPPSEALQAGIGEAEARLARDNAGRALEAAQRALAALWQGMPDEETVHFDLYRLDPPPDNTRLRSRLATSPDLERLAAAARLADAADRLARAEARADWRWSLGVRHLAEPDDQALVAGFSVPLGSASRAVPAQRAAALDRQRIALERDQRRVELETLLDRQLQLMASARATVAMLGDEALPRAVEARDFIDRGYRLGRFPWRELALADAQVADLEARRLAAATDYHAARIEVRRLAGATLDDPKE